MKKIPISKPTGNWLQTERESHEAWAILTRKSPLAAEIMHLLAARVGENNAVIISQGALAELAKASRRGVQNAVKLLNQDRWIEIRRIGERSTVNAYVVNDRVIWGKSRNGLRYSLFSATVIASSKEQPDETELDRNQELRPLRRLPRVGEGQLPTGPGLPPPSQPYFQDMEPDLPSTQQNLPEED